MRTQLVWQIHSREINWNLNVVNKTLGWFGLEIVDSELEGRNISVNNGGNGT
jgi:hypothetical protein